MLKSLFIVLLIFFCLFPHPAPGQETGTMAGDNVIVIYDQPLEKAARNLTVVYSRLRAEVEKQTGWTLRAEPTILLIRERQQFRKLSGHDLFVAFAVPGEDLIVIDYSRMNRHPFSLPVTVKHELCHLLLHQEIDGALLPRWLDEGVAQWVTGGISEIIMDDKGPGVLIRAGVTGRYIPLDSITASFPSHDPDLTLAYEESKSFVEYIIGVYGERALLSILNRLAAGSSIERAVDIICGMPLESLEREWHGYLGKQVPWLAFLSRNLYQILFVFAAVVTLFGFARFIRKKRSYRDDEEDGDDEEEEEIPPYYH